jgi:hypothetical protein
MKVPKGARQFLSLGAGFKYNVVSGRLYLFSASKVRNPLEIHYVFLLLLIQI